MEESSLYAGDLHPGKNYQRQCLVPVNIASVFFIKQNYGVTLEIVCIKDQQQNLRTQSQQEADIILHGQKDPDFLELEELVIQKMRKDKITTVAASDEIIKKYGNFLMSGKGSKKANSISSNMRLMARLLITLRKNDNNSNKALKQFMKPVNFDLIFKCTKEMAGYTQKNADGEFLPTKFQVYH